MRSFFVRIILFEPQIPQNTGNIVRTCAVTGSSLTLVKPLGFKISNRHLRRAGLDYWEGVDVEFAEDLHSYLLKCPNFYFFSSRATKHYIDIAFQPLDFLIFGSESSGIPSSFWQQWPDRFYRIPMKENARCLNLANAVSIVIYEAHRQQRFLNL
jgi:tRNA (cytidine/uridine-2'-O-)-methyltransferase